MSSRLIVFFIFACLWASNSFAQDNLSDLERELLLGDTSNSSASSSESPVQDLEAPKISKPNINVKDLEKIEQAITGPDRIPLEQVLVVQRRFILKEDHQEIIPFYLGVQPADSFRRQFQWGFSWAYHFTESFGIEGLHVAFMTNYNTGLDTRIEEKTGLKTDFGVAPVTIVGSTLIWTPFKSKAATRANVYHFETYFNLGGGVCLSESSEDAAGIFGLGFRIFLNRRSIMKVELRDYAQFGGSVGHRLSLMFGGGIIL